MEAGKGVRRAISHDDGHDGFFGVLIMNVKYALGITMEYGRLQ